MNYLPSIFVAFTLALSSAAAPTLTAKSTLTGRIVAWDTDFAILMSTHDPQQNFIAEVANASGHGTKLIKLVYWVPTNGLRGGAHFIPRANLKYDKKWTLTYHQPDPEGERDRTACDRLDNFARTGIDGKTLLIRDDGEPLLLFQSTQFDGQIKFEHLTEMPCFILDSMTTSRN